MKHRTDRFLGLVTRSNCLPWRLQPDGEPTSGVSSESIDRLIVRYGSELSCKCKAQVITACLRKWS